nr:ATP synthase F0 subunit 8 [Tillus nitidus]
MPQMSPMNWIILFIYFTMIFIYLNSNNYFLIKYFFLMKLSDLKLKIKSWKW